MSRFPDRLLLSPREKAEDRPETRGGRSLWDLEGNFRYITLAGVTILVPKGFVTDLASVPRFAAGIIPPDGPWVMAAIIHDYLYATQGLAGVFTRSQADDIFREAMKDLGVNKVRRNVIYAAVRVGGGRGWGS